MTNRVSIDDLLFGAMWMDAYDGQEDDEANNEAARRLAKWLRTEAQRRESAAQERAVVREVAERTGRSREDVRSALARVASRKATA